MEHLESYHHYEQSLLVVFAPVHRNLWLASRGIFRLSEGQGRKKDKKDVMERTSLCFLHWNQSILDGNLRFAKLMGYLFTLFLHGALCTNL